MNYLASAKWPSVYLPSNRGGIRSIQEPRSISPSPDLSFLSMSNSVTGFLRLPKFVSGKIHELASRLWIVEIEQVDCKPWKDILGTSLHVSVAVFVVNPCS